MRRFSLGLVLLAACNPTDPVIGGDAGPDTGDPSTCPVPSGAGTMHSGVTQAETWTAASSPHIIAADMNVSAVLTLEPCAVVKLAPSRTITVRTNGKIVANGTATQPVTFDARDAGMPWSQIRTIGGTMSFTYTRLLNGGDRQNVLVDAFGVLDVRGLGAGMPLTEVLHADHLTIRDSASQGIYMVEGAAFSATSTALVISGSKHHPMHVWGSSAGSIPDGTYTGNAIDEIDLEAAGQAGVDRDTTFHDRGVPYRIGDPQHNGDILVAAKMGVATLTIEPNVTLRFKKDGIVFVQAAQNTMPATGALVAVGTPDKKITFTSAEAAPAAGDWGGIHFNGVPDPKDKLDYVHVDYAGGTTVFVGGSCLYPDLMKNDAAIRVFGLPSSAFVTNTTITKSARHGFDRGWTGAATISFLGGGNTVDAAKCKETTPGGMCQMNPACP